MAKTPGDLLHRGPHLRPEGFGSSWGRIAVAPRGAVSCGRRDPAPSDRRRRRAAPEGRHGWRLHATASVLRSSRTSSPAPPSRSARTAPRLRARCSGVRPWSSFAAGFCPGGNEHAPGPVGAGPFAAHPALRPAGAVVEDEGLGCRQDTDAAGQPVIPCDLFGGSSTAVVIVERGGSVLTGISERTPAGRGRRSCREERSGIRRRSPSRPGALRTALVRLLGSISAVGVEAVAKGMEPELRSARLGMRAFRPVDLQRLVSDGNTQTPAGLGKALRSRIAASWRAEAPSGSPLGLLEPASSPRSPPGPAAPNTSEQRMPV